MIEWASLRAERVLAEDAAILALNKPAGVSVTGERHDTDLVRLAAEAGETLYPVHRIDKATSGLVLFAKDLAAHGGLTRQFNKRTVDKRYLAVVTGDVPERGAIELPLSTGRKNRVRVAAPREAIAATGDRWGVPASQVFTHVKTYPSLTEFETVWTDGARALLAVRPVTGRRHQIRVHLAWIGFAVVGDPLFDKHSTQRTLLHSWRLSVDAAWRDDERLALEAEPGADFLSAIGDFDPKALADL